MRLLNGMTIAALITGAAWTTPAGAADVKPNSYPPLPDAYAALASDGAVSVRQASYVYSFQPATQRPTKGLIVYPGGLVDVRAYAPLARAIAARGYLVVLVDVPLDIAFLGSPRAESVIRAFPGIRTWAIGGHSLGGVAACTFARVNRDRMRGVVLWASYPAPTDNLRRTGLRVASIYGTRDGLTDSADIAGSKRLLPNGTLFVAIEGGNHSQFGYYGPDASFVQPGDNPATISRDAQKDAVADATADFLDQL